MKSKSETCSTNERGEVHKKNPKAPKGIVHVIIGIDWRIIFK
jgi:hypothetical protein